MVCRFDPPVIQLVMGREPETSSSGKEVPDGAGWSWMGQNCRNGFSLEKLDPDLREGSYKSTFLAKTGIC